MGLTELEIKIRSKDTEALQTDFNRTIEAISESNLSNIRKVEHIIFLSQVSKYIQEYLMGVEK